MQRIGGAGPNAGQASDTALFNHDHRSLGMASAWRIDLKWQERLKRTVEDAEVAPRAVVFDDGDHRLTHGTSTGWLALMLCLRKRGAGPVGSVKFIGAPDSRRNRRRS